MFVAVTCGTSIDRTIVLDRLIPGEVHRPTHVVATAGGKGLNVARAGTTLGATVEAVAVVGGHTGQWVADRLAAEGIAHRMVWSTSETRICVSLADLSTGQMTDVYEPASPVSTDEWEQLIGRTVESIVTGEASWVAVSGRPPAGLAQGAIAALIAACRSTGARVALDTSGAALREGLAAGVDLVKINHAEAIEICGAGTAEALAAELRSHAPFAVVTAGPLGAFGMGHHLASEVRGGYPVGSGDCFLGGLLTALDHGADVADALWLGLGAAVANSEQPGAACFPRCRAEELAAVRAAR
jgi:1-phosphofructokinase family hexose kinase